MVNHKVFLSRNVLKYVAAITMITEMITAAISILFFLSCVSFCCPAAARSALNLQPSRALPLI